MKNHDYDNPALACENGEMTQVGLEPLKIGQNGKTCAFPQICRLTSLPTAVARKVHTLSREERRFLYFNHLSGTNDTSFESPNIGRSESAQKLGMASF